MKGDLQDLNENVDKLKKENEDLKKGKKNVM